MAQRVSVVLVDDIDASEAAETVAFGLDGAHYEIDLSADGRRAWWTPTGCRRPTTSV